MGKLGITINIERTTSRKQKLGQKMYSVIFFALLSICLNTWSIACLPRTSLTRLIQHSQSSCKELVLSSYCSLLIICMQKHIKETKEHT